MELWTSDITKVKIAGLIIEVWYCILNLYVVFTNQELILVIACNESQYK